MSETMAIKRKKGELSLEVIVIAAIVLIVLVILVVIFAGKIRIFGTGYSDCASKGGHCAETSCSQRGANGQCLCESSEASLTGTSCERDDLPGNELCCVSVLK
ncbi:hypothetical protein HZB02_06365 [Candidatus Woesearchaeota archaeon]|nr:hypothetical protein [Candidatus Woesearchaeota archaeon]